MHGTSQRYLQCARALVCACIWAGASLVARAQTLEVTPAESLADHAVSIRATGLVPHAHAILKAELMDGADQEWVSEAQFVADESGTVDTAKQAPVKGSYRTISAMGMVWSMMPTGKDVHSYRTPRGYGPQMITFHLVIGEKAIASAQLTQNFLATGVRRIILKGALHGVLFLPESPGLHAGILVVGGSEGGLPAGKAEGLASRGYAALALAYFRYEELPKDLMSIPLEYFGQALAWMIQRPEIDANRLGVLGTSRGGELALQLGSMYPQIKTVVAYVPADVRYPACCDRPTSPAWTLNGRALAFAVPSSHGPIPASANKLEAAIAVERIHGPILMLSGEQDGVWPSSEMTESVTRRLKLAHFAYEVERLDYAHAGHRAGNPAIVPAWTGGLKQPQTGEPSDPGGTPEGNAESSLDAIPKVLDFLQRSLGAAETH